MKFHCIADEDTVRGYRLAGIEGEVVASEPQASAAVERSVADKDCGVLLMTEDVVALVRRRIDQLRMECERPLVVVIPGPRGPQPGRKSLQRRIEEAVGLSIGGEVR